MGDPHLGLVLEDRYRIQERLAAGGTGVVYRGVQLGLGRAVAIKFLHQSSAGSLITRGRFRREAEAMSRLTHPNLASIIDFGSFGDTLYLVMELYQGQSLRQVLEAGPLELSRAVNLTRQILAGLSSAHDAGVVHRDLKPGNVLLAASVGEDHVKILDFGVAKLISGPDSTEGLSIVTGKPIGTPQYMSPEQARSEPADQRTDLYAVGILLYEMATGIRPFDSGAGFAILRKQVEDPPRPPRELRPEMSPELEAVILKAMSKARADRFQSANEMAAALALVPELEPPRSAVAARRSRRIGGVAMMLLLLIGAAGGGTWYAAEQGLIELPAWSPWQPERAGAEIALAPVEPTPPIDAAPAPPPWSPPDAQVVLAPPPSQAPVENSELRGNLFGERFRPAFARVAVDGARALVTFAAQKPAGHPCAQGELVGPGVLEIILPRPAMVEGERIAEVDDAVIRGSIDGEVTTLEARWWLELESLDPKAGLSAGKLRIRGDKARLTGSFDAIYCPDPRDYRSERPEVSGVRWDPDHAPEPDALPPAAVAGAFGLDALQPAHVSLVAARDPERWVLSFFAEPPVDPCAELGAADRGVAVMLPADLIDDQYAISAVLERGTSLPWVGLQPDRGKSIEADILALRIDQTSPADVRGRIYVAASDYRRSLFAGAFRAVDCR